MAAGQVHILAKYVANMTLAALASLWASDVIKMGMITTATTPGVSDSDPRWGAGGAQDYSLSEVTPGGGYAAGGLTLAGCTSTLSGTNVFLNATSPVLIAANAGNPNNAAWGILYDSTDAGKHVFGFVDFGGVINTIPGFTMNLNGVASGTQPVFQGAAS